MDLVYFVLDLELHHDLVTKVVALATNESEGSFKLLVRDLGSILDLHGNGQLESGVFRDWEVNGDGNFIEEAGNIRSEVTLERSVWLPRPVHIVLHLNFSEDDLSRLTDQSVEWLVDQSSFLGFPISMIIVRLRLA